MHAAYAKSLAHIRWSEHLNLCPRDAKCMYSFCINLLTFTPLLCCCFVVFLWAPWEAYRHTLVISGDQTVLAFKIAFLCNNWENLLQGSSSAQACKYYISCWAVRVIHMYVYIYVCVYTCFFSFFLPTAIVRYLGMCRARDEQDSSFEWLVPGWWPRWLSRLVIVSLGQGRAARQLRTNRTPHGLLKGDPNSKCFVLHSIIHIYI